MPLRTAFVPLLLILLAGCGSQPPAPPAPVELSSAPHSKLNNELSGSLIGAPAGSEVELALLEVDRRDQPDRLLSNVQFNPDVFPVGQRVELRGRVTRAGQLIMRLPALQIRNASSQALGPLQLVPAP